jgi:uncharacterized protein YdeI (BOF family)
MKLMNTSVVGLGGGLIVAGLVGCAPNESSRAAMDDGANPYVQPDRSWVSVSGEATDVRDDRFALDYGEGEIRVDMEGSSWYDENHDRLDGDRVVVYGEIDNDLFETTTIDANSVYVEGMNTYVYAGDDDRLASFDYWGSYDPNEIGDATIRGTVTETGVNEFTVNTGARELTVDTLELRYDPMDYRGYQRVMEGDRVIVTGEMDRGFWDERELSADAIVTLDDDWY